MRQSPRLAVEPPQNSATQKKAVHPHSARGQQPRARPQQHLAAERYPWWEQVHLPDRPEEQRKTVESTRMAAQKSHQGVTLLQQTAARVRQASAKEGEAAEQAHAPTAVKRQRQHAPTEGNQPTVRQHQQPVVTQGFRQALRMHGPDRLVRWTPQTRRPEESPCQAGYPLQ